MKKRLLGLLLAIVIVVGLVPNFTLTAFAAEELNDITTGITLKDADGDDYYEVGTPDELMAFANLVNDEDSENYTISIELTKDIDMTGKEWSTIIFAGNIDGAGHMISNLEMVETDMDVYLAGFIYSVGATVKNLYFVNCSAIITSSATTEDDCYAGIIAAAAEGIKVENCSAINCTVKSEGVAGDTSYAGGLLGAANGPVSFDYCSFQDGSVSISASGDYNTSFAGGIAGGVWDFGDGIGVSITNSFCSGNVTVTSKGYSSAGGIIGLDQNEEGTETHIYSNCYFSGNIEGLGYAAGLSGDFCATATITNFAVLSDSITSPYTDPFIIGERKDITYDELYIGEYTQFELNAPDGKESWLSGLTGSEITEEQASAYQIENFKSNLHGELADGMADVEITLSQNGEVKYTATTDADGEYNFGKQVLRGDYTLNIAASDAAEAYEKEITIDYATNHELDITRVIKYTVTFDVNGYGTAPASQNVHNGDKVTEPEAPTAKGYVFGGWYKETDCTNKWDFDTDTVTDDTTLYAKWTACDHSGSTSKPTCTDDAICSICGGTITATGHTYDQEKATEEYLKAAADCTNAAVYYKSCACGASSKDTAGEATFTSGAANGHSHGATWKSDKDNHWHECACGDKADLAKHIGTIVHAKEATTTEKGYTGDTVCNICGYEIAKGEDIPVKATPTTPNTGDNSNMALWLALMVMSAFGLVSATVLGKKRKVNR